MEQKVLVAYASTHGSTKEIAEFVCKSLQQQGLAADLREARDVHSLDGYSAVVLGAPLYMFRWHKDATRFLNQHRKALAGGIPAAIFAGGPFGEDKAEDWQSIRQNLDTILAKFPWLSPASIEIVGGKFDPAHLRFPYNLIPAMKQMPASDLRDWNKIHAWATSLPELFTLPAKAQEAR